MDTSPSTREQILGLLKHIIMRTFKDVPADVYLFGSWARKEEKRTSDIDIAVHSYDNVPASKWIELHEQIEESVLPYRVDIVDLSRADATLKKRVKKEGILWKDYMKGSSRQAKH